MVGMERGWVKSAFGEDERARTRSGGFVLSGREGEGGVAMVLSGTASQQCGQDSCFPRKLGEKMVGLRADFLLLS